MGCKQLEGVTLYSGDKHKKKKRFRARTRATSQKLKACFWICCTPHTLKLSRLSKAVPLQQIFSLPSHMITSSQDYIWLPHLEKYSVWHSHKNRHIDQQYRMEGTEINLHIYSQVIFYKGVVKSVQQKRVFSRTGPATAGHVPITRCTSRLTSSYRHKFHQAQDVNKS